MDAYIEIVIKSDEKQNDHVVLSRIYTQFHLALVKLNMTEIGVSFPQKNNTLGNTLRIHGSELNLKKLEEITWLTEPESLYNKTQIQFVPHETKYRSIFVKRSTMSQAKLRRLMKRKSGLSTDEIREYKHKMLTRSLDNPYLDLYSFSTEQVYRKFFDFGELVNLPVQGSFDTYGLSKTATIPWF